MYVPINEWSKLSRNIYHSTGYLKRFVMAYGWDFPQQVEVPGLVMTKQFAKWKMAIEIVDLPIKN